jgi:protease IV
MKRRILWLLGLSFVTFLIFFIWVSTSDSDFMASPNRIGVVEVRGAISNSQETVKAIKDFRRNENVKAILVRVESPGGGIGPSQEIYRELRRTIQQKPVVTSMGSIAASGGYYIAAGSTHIVANPGTITGSIGVISYFPHLREVFDKIGFGYTIIKSGQYKDIGNPGRDMTPEERALLQGTIDEAFRQFVVDVATGRNLPEEKVREVADGRIIMGQNALQFGLVDELGNFEDAVNAAALLGKIEGEPQLVYAKKKRASLVDLLIGSDVSEKVNSYLDGSINPLRFQVPNF